MTKRLHAGGQHLCSGSVRLHGMALGRFQPLAGAGPAHIGGTTSFSQLLKPRTDGVKAVVDLALAAGPGPGLAIHAFQHA